MRCVWLKAYERSRAAALEGAFRRPCARRSTTASGARRRGANLRHRPRPADARRLARLDVAARGAARRRAASSSRPSCPRVDSGGLDAVRERFEPFAPWVDAVNATDNTAAHAHASPLAVAIALKLLGVEPVMQLVCRDRNRLALAGRHRRRGAARDREPALPDRRRRDRGRRARGAARLRPRQPRSCSRRRARSPAGRYLSGRALEPAPHLFLGAAENPGAPPFEHRVERALKKVRAGARFLQLQVCFEHAHLERFMAAAVASGLAEQAALLPSICLVRSPSALRFMDEKVPGISVPAAMIERVERAADQRGGLLRPRRRARRAHARAARRRRPAPDQLPPRRRHRALCQRLGIPTREEREASGHRPPVAV